MGHLLFLALTMIILCLAGLLVSSLWRFWRQYRAMQRQHEVRLAAEAERTRREVGR